MPTMNSDDLNTGLIYTMPCHTTESKNSGENAGSGESETRNEPNNMNRTARIQTFNKLRREREFRMGKNK